MKIKINPYSEINQCPTCGELFKSLTAFDDHRTGKFGVNRRCLDKHEILSRGMCQNRDNLWVTREMTQQDKARTKAV
jgi:hypothetical protein